MFFSKTTPSISISQDKLDLSSHPASPTDSLMSTTPSLAPLQASRRGFFNSFQRPALSSSSVTSVATTSKSTEAAQSAKIAALQQEIEQLKEMADINQLTMRDVADDLQKKDMECADLRCTVSMLDAGLKQAVQPIIAASAAPSQLELKTMQENLEFANDCRQTLKRSVRAKEEEMVKLADKIEELAQELKGADKSTAAASSNLLRSLNNANDQLADLQRTITDKDERLATVSSELFTAKLFHDKLLQEHGEYSHNACTQQHQIASLQKENDLLAARTAAAESKMAKYATHIATFTTQFQSLSTLAAESQAKYITQVDAMYIQQQQSDTCFTQQLQDKDALIASLQSRLADSELAATTAKEFRKSEIARLDDQLSRLTFQASESQYQQTVWQDYANEQGARIGQLQAENKAELQDVAGRLKDAEAAKQTADESEMACMDNQLLRLTFNAAEEQVE